MIIRLMPNIRSTGTCVRSRNCLLLSTNAVSEIVALLGCYEAYAGSFGTSETVKRSKKNSGMLCSVNWW
jgi:hypothetical protein